MLFNFKEDTIMFGKTSSKSKDYLLISLITGLIVNIAMLAIAYFVY